MDSEELMAQCFTAVAMTSQVSFFAGLVVAIVAIPLLLLLYYAMLWVMTKLKQ